jgi:hypothetical protein
MGRYPESPCLVDKGRIDPKGKFAAEQNGSAIFVYLN